MTKNLFGAADPSKDSILLTIIPHADQHPPELPDRIQHTIVRNSFASQGASSSPPMDFNPISPVINTTTTTTTTRTMDRPIQNISQMNPNQQQLQQLQQFQLQQQLLQQQQQQPIQPIQPQSIGLPSTNVITASPNGNAYYPIYTPPSIAPVNVVPYPTYNYNIPAAPIPAPAPVPQIHVTSSGPQTDPVAQLRFEMLNRDLQDMKDLLNANTAISQAQHELWAAKMMEEAKQKQLKELAKKENEKNKSKVKGKRIEKHHAAKRGQVVPLKSSLLEVDEYGISRSNTQKTTDTSISAMGDEDDDDGIGMETSRSRRFMKRAKEGGKSIIRRLTLFERSRILKSTTLLIFEVFHIITDALILATIFQFGFGTSDDCSVPQVSTFQYIYLSIAFIGALTCAYEISYWTGAISRLEMWPVGKAQTWKNGGLLLICAEIERRRDGTYIIWPWIYLYSY